MPMLVCFLSKFIIQVLHAENDDNNHGHSILIFFLENQMSLKQIYMYVDCKYRCPQKHHIRKSQKKDLRMNEMFNSATVPVTSAVQLVPIVSFLLTNLQWYLFPFSKYLNYLLDKMIFKLLILIKKNLPSLLLNLHFTTSDAIFTKHTKTINSLPQLHKGLNNMSCQRVLFN